MVVVTAGFPPGSGLVPVVGASVPGSGSVVVVAVLEGDRVVVVVVVVRVPMALRSARHGDTVLVERSSPNSTPGELGSREPGPQPQDSRSEQPPSP
ncbi:MAG: hypothetical protein M3N51_10750 [Actinomycetota bacterium]|nr:hypothetical protein [Actinomycetota bacterium]